MNMHTPATETTINIFQDHEKNYIEVVPPLEDFELDLLQCTGAGERLFEDKSAEGDKTILWNWKMEDEEVFSAYTDETLTIADIDNFTTRAFAYQVVLLREHKGHTVRTEDNL